MTAVLSPGVGDHGRITDITPFTFRDGATYLEVLETIKRWVNGGLLDEINKALSEASNRYAKEIAALFAASIAPSAIAAALRGAAVPRDRRISAVFLAIASCFLGDIARFLDDACHFLPNALGLLRDVPQRHRQAAPTQFCRKLASDGRCDNRLLGLFDDSRQTVSASRIKLGEDVVEDEDGLAALRPFARFVAAQNPPRGELESKCIAP